MVRVVRTQRLGLVSRNGNPRYSVVLSDGNVYATKKDASVNHRITNSDYMENDVDIVLDKGEIIDIYVVKDNRKWTGSR